MPYEVAEAFAEHAYTIGNADPDHLDGTDAIAALYRRCGRRSVMPGDIVVVGEVPLHCPAVRLGSPARRLPAHRHRRPRLHALTDRKCR